MTIKLNKTPNINLLPKVSLAVTHKIAAKFHKALALHNSGQLAEAKTTYEEILKLNPFHFDALQLLGTIAAQTKQWDQALALLNDALKINSSNSSVHNNLGNVFKELNRLDEALESYERAIKLSSNNADAYFNSGVVLNELNRLNEALVCYERAIQLSGNNGDVYFNCGVVLNKLKLFDKALASFDRAIELKHDHAEAYSNRGTVLHELKRFDEALTSYATALNLKHNFAEAFSNRGVTLNELNHLEDALFSFDRAISLKPNYPEAFYNRGNVLHELNCLNESLASYQRAVDFKPDYAEAHHNKSHLLLLMGNLRKGFLEYEWRWIDEKASSKAGKKSYTQPLWLGQESIANKTILIWCEQGLGDTLQFCRYVRLVAELGAKVILEVQRPLVNLLQNLEGVSQVIEEGCAQSDFDYQCPLMSLPLAFKTELVTIPSSTPYLKSDSKKLEQWSRLLGMKSNPRIGLVWSGSTIHKNDKNRSLVLANLLSHLPPNFDYICLQKEVREIDKEILINSTIKYFCEQLIDFTDTAALCDLMDIVISVDTSVAHLSGALGKTTWIMLPYVPDWRWLMNRDDSPWYGSVRLYRQAEDRQYLDVLGKVADELLKLPM